jgi:hypothetical protein
VIDPSRAGYGTQSGIVACPYEDPNAVSAHSPRRHRAPRAAARAEAAPAAPRRGNGMAGAAPHGRNWPYAHCATDSTNGPADLSTVRNGSLADWYGFRRLGLVRIPRCGRGLGSSPAGYLSSTQASGWTGQPHGDKQRVVPRCPRSALVPSARREYGHNRAAHTSTAFSRGDTECFVAYSWSAWWQRAW